MLVNYFKIAWRNLRKNGFYTLVNIAGLFIGLLFSLLIGVYVWGEFQVNKSLKNADHQYILTSRWKDPNLGMELTTVGPLAKTLKETYPDLVANYYRWDGLTSGVSKGDKHFREGIQLGDSTLLPMYGFKLLHGDPSSALSAPFSLVISAKAALKYFGKTAVLGETLNIQSFSGGNQAFRITGVLQEPPQNSVTQLLDNNTNDFFIPTSAYTYFGRTSLDSWQNTIIPSYVELQPGAKTAELEQAIRQVMAQNGDAFLNENLTVRPVLLHEYYLNKNNGLVKRMLGTLSAVGLFILFMALVNFVNLAIGRSGSRIREMGVRKTLGGQKTQLMLQLLTESLVFSAISTALAFIAYPFTTPLFEQIIGKNLPELASFPIAFWALPLILAGLIGLLAGFYPAFVLSALKPVDSLKGKLKTAQEKVYLRRHLLGFQFCIANFVLISAVVVASQVNHFFGNNLGYDKAFIVTAQTPRDWTLQGLRKMIALRDEFARMPQINQISLSFEIPNGNSGGQPRIYLSSADSSSAIASQSMVTDEAYLKTYLIPLKSGHFFENSGADSSTVVLNEKAAKALGFSNPEDAVGHRISVQGNPATFTIRGVIQDFQFGSMQTAIQPMVVFPVYGNPIYRYFSFKIRPGQISLDLEAIQKKWSELMPGSSFEYTFLDKSLEKLYRSELQLKKAAYLSTALALLIALLGVMGLVSLNLQLRVKEIGVRKVLGASTIGILGLFLKEFMRILWIAGILSCPFAWYFLQQWLNDYASRITLSPWVFGLTVAGLSVFIAVLISFQSLGSALANPVKSLRSE